MSDRRKDWQRPALTAYGNLSRITMADPNIALPKCPGSGDTEFAQNETFEHPPVGSLCS